MTVFVVLSASCLFAAQASARAVAVEQGCVVDQPPAVGDLTVQGSGFSPGDYISLQAAYDPNFGTGIADANGAFETTFAGPPMATTGPGVGTFELLATDLTTADMAATSFHVANLAVAVHPATAKGKGKGKGKSKARKGLVYSVSGFPDGAELFVHYVRGQKLVRTARLGKASGACGALKTTTSFNASHNRYGRFVVQVDESRQYSAAMQPNAVTEVVISRP